MPLSLFYLTTAINVLLVFGLCFESQARRDLGHHLHFSQRKLNIINRNTRKAPPSRLLFRNYVDQDGRWPIQARFWLEWGSSHVIDLENFGFPHPWLRVVCGVRTRQHSARLFEDRKKSIESAASQANAVSNFMCCSIRHFFDLATLVFQILDAPWLVVATLGSGLAL